MCVLCTGCIFELTEGSKYSWKNLKDTLKRVNSKSSLKTDLAAKISRSEMNSWSVLTFLLHSLKTISAVLHMDSLDFPQGVNLSGE